MFRLPVGDVFERCIDLLKENGSSFFNALKASVLFIVDNFENLLNIIPWWLIILIIIVIAMKVSGKKLALFTGLGLIFIYSLDLWKETMDTLSLVSGSTMITLLIGIPLGILMSKSEKTQKIIQPILDFMQTMPAFIYLIPSVIFFGLGKMPGAIATIIFAMPPVVKLTNLGIRQVPKDVIEAGLAFGCTQKQMLQKIQIPLALPTILTGINQTIMLSLSMVVISAMIGARGLGEVVYSGVTQMKIGRGFEGGISVVILAIILDRLTQSIGNTKK